MQLEVLAVRDQTCISQFAQSLSHSHILSHPRAGPRTNVWSSTFDPGRNANMNKIGSSYYDKPNESNPGGVWDQVLQSEAARPSSPPSTSAVKGGSMDADAVRKMFATEKIEAALKKAETGGKVDYDRVRAREALLI